MRAGTGLLFILLGIALVGFGRRRPANVALGLLAVGYGLPFVLFNVAGQDPTLAPLAMWLSAVGFLLGGVGFAGVAAFFPSPLRREERRLLVVPALLAAVGTTAGLVEVLRTGVPDAASLDVAATAAFPRYVGTAITRLTTMLGWAVASLLALRAWRGHPDATASAAVALTFTLWGAAVLGSHLVAPDGFLAFLVARGAGLAAAVGAWLLATTGPTPRPARNAALALLGAALVGAAYTAATGGAVPLGETALPGVLRTVAFGILVWAILRHRLLGFDLSIPAARRGTVVSLGLVAFFAVAEVAQETLSGANGVLLGGVAAGVLVFAAIPLQRAAERLVSRDVPVAPVGRASPPAAAEAYRAALRVALHDGAMTVDEERHLAEVAEALGLSHPEALRLRDEVAGARR